MLKEITVKWLVGKNACKQGIDWFKAQDEKEPIAVIKKLNVKKCGLK